MKNDEIILTEKRYKSLLKSEELVNELVTQSLKMAVFQAARLNKGELEWNGLCLAAAELLKKDKFPFEIVVEGLVGGNALVCFVWQFNNSMVRFSKHNLTDDEYASLIFKVHETT